MIQHKAQIEKLSQIAANREASNLQQRNKEQREREKKDTQIIESRARQPKLQIAAIGGGGDCDCDCARAHAAVTPAARNNNN